MSFLVPILWNCRPKNIEHHHYIFWLAPLSSISIKFWPPLSVRIDRSPPPKLVYQRSSLTSLCPIKGHLLSKVVFRQGLSSTKGCLPPKVVFHKRSLFHRRSSSTEGCLPLQVFFHWRSSSTEGCLPPKVVFNWRSPTTEGCLPQKVIFHRRSSSTKCRLLPKVVSHWRSSSTKGHLPQTITPWLILYLWKQSTYQISASYLA